MRRYFISQHPTFGTYANPIKWKIEESPYFFWWLALTLNKDYLALCRNPSAKRFSKAMKSAHKDFGDVRYEGDRHLAFTKWWTEKLPNGETRGAYLFAEPLTETKVEIVRDLAVAEQLLADKRELLIRVPKELKRRHIDSSLNRIFKKEIEFEKGRQTRNPNRSKARYRLSKPISIANLQKAFSLYLLITQAKSDGRRITNAQLAEQVGITVKQRNTQDEVWDSAYIRRVTSVAVSRKKQTAKVAIYNAALGTFP